MNRTTGAGCLNPCERNMPQQCQHGANAEPKIADGDTHGAVSFYGGMRRRPTP